MYCVKFPNTHFLHTMTMHSQTPTVATVSRFLSFFSAFLPNCLMVRLLNSSCFRPPWPFEKKGARGWRKNGHVIFEEHKWPGQQKEFPELSPKFLGNNLKPLWGYTGVNRTGFNDPETGEYVHVPEMVPELVVPDLSNFELKPYVSYKTDAKIEERLRAFDKKLIQFAGNEKEAIANSKSTELWPPPPIDAKMLFDFFYADKIRQAFEKGKKQKKV